MSDSEVMPKVDLSKVQSDKNNIHIKDYMKLVEDQNFRRVERLKRLRRNNLITGLTLGAGVLSIYAYSMLAVKQETFLDDFDEPKKLESAL